MTVWQFENLTAERLIQEVLVPRYGYAVDGAWLFAFQGKAGDWKAHVYADSADDWVRVAQVILPYLHLHRVFHKTFRDLSVLAAVNSSPTQKGKAFTIYGEDVNTLKQVMHDLDCLFMAYDLGRSDKPLIFGDKGLGQSSRLFYRYDKDLSGSYRLNDGQYRPEGVEDPFAFFQVEAAMASLPPGESMVLGREATGGSLWPASVSGRHVQLFRTQEGVLMVEDLGAPHGTFVSGFRIASPTAVVVGDTLHLGPQSVLSVLRPFS